MAKRKYKHPVYAAYRYRGQDPVIGRMREVWIDAGEPRFSSVKKDGGPSPGTPRNWFNGKTISPRHETAAAFIGAHGKEFAIVDKRR